MGQYYLIVNIDRKQFLSPQKCGDGLKLLEFAGGGCGVLSALAILLADGNGRGGGDLRSENPIIGGWAGDRVVIAGDYADEGRFTADPSLNLYRLAAAEFEDVSRQALRALADEPWLAEELKQRQTWAAERSQTVYDYAMGWSAPGESLAQASRPAGDR